MDSETSIVLPGDPIDASAIPARKKQPLRLGPGLRLIPPQEIVPTVAGQLITDWKKNSLWVDYNGGRYIPSTGDLIIGQIHHSSADFYFVSLTPYTSHALLPSLAFEMATKKTRPNLAAGSLVYARVALANKHMDPELECVNPSTGKSEGLGPLVGGMVFGISLGMARRLLMPRTDASKAVVLEELGAAGLAFETAVGRNGKVWVNSESAKTVVAVGRTVRETDEGGLDVAGQKKLVRRLLREMS